MTPTSKLRRKKVGVWRGTRVRRGESAEVKLAVSKSYTGRSVRLPVHVWRGAEPGPTVFITGAVHGDEINGTGTIRQIIQEPPFKLRAGSLILVPVVNISAFEQLSRYSPDRRDLNRAFPGSARGSVTGRLADVIFRDIVARSDYGIDLHTASIRRTNYPNVRADLDNDGVAHLASLFGAELVLNSPGPEGTLRRTATDAGCPTIVLEAGEVWKVEPSVVEYSLRGIRNVLVGLNMIDGEATAPRYRIVAEKTKWMRAERGGFLRFHVHPGSTVAEGELLATNTTLSGVKLGTIEAPADAIVLGMTTLPSVAPGDAVANLAFPDEKALRKMERVRGALPDESLLARLEDDLASSVLESAGSTADGDEEEP